MRSSTSPGLSPRVWGSRDRDATPERGQRSIPTGVGQPIRNLLCPGGHTVYPHGCGAARLAERGDPCGGGLSPRVWGSPGPRGQHDGDGGSIPTGVGQPAASAPTPAAGAIAVYPHGCGAARVRPGGGVGVYGLSPRVWGSPIRSMASNVGLRSIPTGVGQPLEKAMEEPLIHSKMEYY